MSILQHPGWPELRAYIRIEVYDRDGGTAHARHRIEVDRPPEEVVLRRVLALEMPCVVCGRVIHPVRPRAKGRHLYFAATCALEVTLACARSGAARGEYDAVRAAVETWRAGRSDA